MRRDTFRASAFGTHARGFNIFFFVTVSNQGHMDRDYEEIDDEDGAVLNLMGSLSDGQYGMWSSAAASAAFDGGGGGGGGRGGFRQSDNAFLGPNEIERLLAAVSGQLSLRGHNMHASGQHVGGSEHDHSKFANLDGTMGFHSFLPGFAENDASSMGASHDVRSTGSLAHSHPSHSIAEESLCYVVLEIVIADLLKVCVRISCVRVRVCAFACTRVRNSTSSKFMIGMRMHAQRLYSGFHLD